MLQILLTILSLFWSVRNAFSWYGPPPRPMVAPSITLPAAIETALLANAEALRPQVSTQWVRSRSSTLSIDAFDKRYESPRQPRSEPLATEALLRGTEYIDLEWQADGKYRQAWRSEVMHPATHQLLARGNRVYAFDGETFFDHGLNAGEAHSLSMMSKTDIASKDDLYDSWQVRLGYFYACGLKLPAGHQEIARNDPPASTLLTLLAKGAALRSVDSITNAGVTMIRLTMQTNRRLSGEGFYETLMLDTVGPRPTAARTVIFDLDPARNDALCHVEIRDSDNQLLLTDDCIDFVAYPGRAVWLPNRCTIRQYAHAAKPPETTTTFDLKRLSFDPIAKADFTIEDHQAGTWIVDHNDTHGKTIGIVQPDGTLKGWKTVVDEADIAEGKREGNCRRKSDARLSLDPLPA